MRYHAPHIKQWNVNGRKFYERYWVIFSSIPFIVVPSVWCNFTHEQDLKNPIIHFLISAVTYWYLTTSQHLLINPYHICNVTIIEFEFRNQRELSLGGHFICQKTIDLKTTLHLFCWSLNNLSLPTVIVCTSTAVQKGIILIYCYKQDLKRNGW